MQVANRKLMCTGLGLPYQKIRAERVKGARAAHPDCWYWVIKLPAVGRVVRQLEHDAWHAFFDLAERKARAKAKAEEERPAVAPIWPNPNEHW